MNTFIIFLGKTVAFLAQNLNIGSGSTWPGHVALLLNRNFIKDILRSQTEKQRLKIVLIAGTNGKTTTSKLIQTILEKNGQKVFHNETGANLLNGIASTLIQYSNLVGKINYDFAIFEVDENTLPLALKEFTPDYLILLNLFRDQLDRYGEVNTISIKWKEAITKLPPKTSLILNADDPLIASLGLSLCHPQVFYFGLNDKAFTQTNHQHASDSTYCPNCGSKLTYKTVYFSHLGDWECKKCNLKRPKLDLSGLSNYPLFGLYNKYNTNAAVLFANLNNINNEIIEQSLKKFSPAFGRQEVIKIDGKTVQILLSKNPTSFNESLRTVSELGGKNILLVLNDRIPDGRDVSWIWDVDFEEYLNKFQNVTVSGDRAYDMTLRIKYASKSQISNPKSQIQNSNFKIYEDLKEAIKKTLEQLPKNETLYILPTYSAMLEVRKILTGKRIL